MNLEETPTEAAFRAEVREWLADVPRELSGARDFEKRLDFDRLMAARGFLGYMWPREFGGAGGDPILASILEEEVGEFGMPLQRSPSRMGTNLLGPTLMAHGTAEQRERFLPHILAVDEVWCQGFSEPNAGSDLANVQCLAVENGDGFRLSGSKVWTTQAQHADWCFVLARSDVEAPRHKNLSFMLVSMKEPGVDVRPLEQLTREAEFNEVFFDDVAVPRENVVGKINSGWQVAMTTLASERTYGLRSRYGYYIRELQAVARLVREHASGHQRAIWTGEIGHLYADLAGIRNLAYKVLSLAAAGDDVAPVSPISHLWWTRTHQRVADLGFRVASAVGVDQEYWYHLWLDSRGETIYGGSSQIQRNLISERELGLPR
jgi:alkylation response protein AidB-like acyl-CoA dehydrogenase